MKKIKALCQVTDYNGHLWDVWESRPTPHSWPLLLGRPAKCTRTDLPRKGPATVIITRELADYLELHRMNRSALCLPIGQNTIFRLRTKLGMNYVADRSRWWDAVREKLTGKPSAPPTEADPRLESRRPHKTWSEEEYAKLAELMAKGYDAGDIDVELGKKPRTVSAFRNKLFGKQKHPSAWSQEEKALLVNLRHEGYSAGDIALLLGRSEKSVSHKIRKLLPPPGRQGKVWTAEDVSRLRLLFQKGLNDKEIALALGRTIAAIRIMRRKVVGLLPKGPNPAPRHESREDHKSSAI